MACNPSWSAAPRSRCRVEPRPALAGRWWRPALAVLTLLVIIGAGWLGPAGPARAQPATPAPHEGPLAEAIASERFRQLAAELRCLVCQNQALADSNAPLAQDLRNEVARLMVAGRSDAEIKQFLTDRYGEFVLYRPALSARNALLWAGPFVLLAIGAVSWWRLGRRRQTGDAGEADLARVDALLGRDAAAATPPGPVPDPGPNATPTRTPHA